MQQKGIAVFPAKKIATKVKHQILESCLKAWGGIIINSNAGRQVRLAFVETCCGSGLYAPGDDAKPDVEYDAGSAIIGIETLNALLSHGRSVSRDVSGKALFINENAEELETLNATVAEHFESKASYRLLPNRLCDVVKDVALFCDRHFAFLLIDPYGPSAIPFSVVSKLVSLSRADCLINFPYYSVHKWIGWLECDSHEGATRLAIVDQLTNGDGWREIALRNRQSGRALEEAILDHYMDELSKLGVGAMSIPMTFEDKKRTMYHLVFTSRSTAGLANAKRQLQQGEAYQAALKGKRPTKTVFRSFIVFSDPGCRRTSTCRRDVRLCTCGFIADEDKNSKPRWRAHLGDADSGLSDFVCGR